MTAPDTNERTIRRLYDSVWNGADPSVADELVADDYYIHDREVAEDLRGPDLYRALADMTRHIFPDMSFTIEDSVAEGDEIAVRWAMTGTHEGDQLSVEPTGKAVTLDAIEINRFEDGKLAETWTQSDMLGLLQQVDAIPAMEK